MKINHVCLTLFTQLCDFEGSSSDYRLPLPTAADTQLPNSSIPSQLKTAVESI
ncbi:MAG: hypothetical protein IPL46_18875 [Saprospiraceae bacterium]|nr:hypothetical protein [Saprospiraceae bacterium]